MTKEQLLAEAMTLSASEREALADELMRSVTDAERDEIDALWLAEAKRRDAAFRSGAVSASPVGEVIQRVRPRSRP